MALMWGLVWCRQHTDFFRDRPPTRGSKLRLQLTVRTALVQDIRLTTKNCVCMVKNSKTTSNQPIKLDLYQCHDETYGGGGG